MAAIADLTESEKYLVALLQDQSGIDAAELCWSDETAQDSVFRCWDFQYAMYRNTEKFQVDLCGRSLGKALALETPVPTPTGWTTMGALHPGDIVFDDQGEPTKVSDAYDVLHGRPCYEVVFSDGTSVIADEDHQWLTADKAARVAEGRGSPAKAQELFDKKALVLQLRAAGHTFPAISRMLGYKEPTGAWALAHREIRWVCAAPKVRTTAEIRRTLRTANGKEANHSIPLAGALQLPDIDMPIDAYFLGFWLGDGCSNNAHITTADLEIIEKLRIRGFIVTKLAADYLWAVTWPDVDKHSWKTGSVSARLRQMGVLENKHIPQEYLRASEWQRRDLLAGLVDSDGHLRAGPHTYAEITQKSSVLAEGIMELLFSLGEKPTCHTKIATINGKDCGPVFVITWRPLVQPAWLPRKAARWQAVDGNSARVSERRITDVRPVASRPVRCITVESDSHLFLAGVGMVPTHNSLGIQMRAFAFPFTSAGEEMLITAPEMIHLDPVTKKVEDRILSVRIGREYLKTGSGVTGFTHRPFEANFRNGARVIGRIPQKDGRGVKGQHPKKLEMDEAQDYPEPGWVELGETLKYADDDATWRAHGVSRGVRDRYYKQTQKESGWFVHRYTAMHRADWTPEERKAKAELYGSRDHPDYRRNILGLHGDASSALFVLTRLMACVDQDQNSNYNTTEYTHIRIDDDKLRDTGMPIDAMLDFPASHQTYGRTWVGQDVGMTNHPSEIVVLGEDQRQSSGGKRADGVPDMRLRTLARIHLERISARDQRIAMAKICDFYRPVAFSMDKTGIGLPIWSEIMEGDNAQLALVMRGYNFSEKIPVGYLPQDEDTPYDPENPDGEPIMANVLEYSSDCLRTIVDQRQLILPWDIDMLREFQGQTYTVIKSTTDHYGKKQFNKGKFHCLAEGTLVTTITGEVPIEQIRVGDLVATRKGYRRVLDAWLADPDAEVLQVSFANGSSLTGTAEHLVWTQQDGWTRLDALRMNTSVHVWANPGANDRFESNSEASPTTAIRTVTHSPTETTIDSRGATCIATSGSWLTVPSRPTTTSTTKIAMRTTTISAIWFAFRTMSMLLFTRLTPSTTARSDRRSGEPTWKRSVRWLRGGTAQRRALRGIRTMAESRGCPGRLSVKSVERRSRPSDPGSTAPLDANSEFRSSEFASAVSDSRYCGVTVETSATTVTRVERLADRARVYDLTVDGMPEFVANGILVHNCLDAFRMAVLGYKQEHIDAMRALSAHTFEPVFDEFLV